jgi:hypothetical protein
MWWPILFTYIFIIIKLSNLGGVKTKIAVLIAGTILPILSVLYLMGFIVQGVMAPYSKLPSGYYKSETELTGRIVEDAIEVSGRFFKMPREYLTRKNINHYQKSHALFLRYVLPSFQPESSLTAKDKKKIIHNKDNISIKEYLTTSGNMMVIEPFKRIPIPKIAEQRNLGVIPLVPMDKQNTPEGLEGYLLYRPSKEEKVHKRDVFLIRDNNEEVIELLECSARLSVVNPSCDHWFLDKKLLYKIHYNRYRYLSSWKEMKSSAIKFVDSYEVFPSFNNKQEEINFTIASLICLLFTIPVWAEQPKVEKPSYERFTDMDKLHKEYPFLNWIEDHKMGNVRPVASIAKLENKLLDHPLLLVHVMGSGYCGMSNCPLEFYEIKENEEYSKVPLNVSTGFVYTVTCPNSFSLNMCGGGMINHCGLWKYGNGTFKHVGRNDNDAESLPQCEEIKNMKGKSK